jgi:hypothetical protein
MPTETKPVFYENVPEYVEPTFGAPGDGVYWRRPNAEEQACGIRAVFVDERSDEERQAARQRISTRSIESYYNER